jgi:hypothetical protein
VTSSSPDTVAGYILTRSADLYGRCICFVGRGAPPHDDGSSIFVDVEVLRTTANRHLIGQGLAYPTYYRDLFPDLRNEFTVAAKQARDARLGVWAADATTSGFTVSGLASLQDDIVIVPKLFRRLVDYLLSGTTPPPASRPSSTRPPTSSSSCPPATPPPAWTPSWKSPPTP